MSEREYVAALERDLKAMTERAERGERAFKSAQITIAELVARAIEAERRVETMRQIAAAIAANTNKIQRIAAGEKE